VDQEWEDQDHTLVVEVCCMYLDFSYTYLLMNVY
jgi:hypothetical protein